MTESLPEHLARMPLKPPRLMVDDGLVMDLSMMDNAKAIRMN
jgi:hypothetical protein